ncbi:MAG: aminopeptidase [Myxococcaceae bacterium]|nr:aminopeptidase [Myxococcaceae bacterium]
MTIPALVSADDRAQSFDALVVVAPSPLTQTLAHVDLPQPVRRAVDLALAADRALGRGPVPPALLPCAEVPGGRVVVAPMNALADDVDDVRLVGEATSSAVMRAMQAGARRPKVLVHVPDDPKFSSAKEIAALAALCAGWEPLEAREARGTAPRDMALEAVAVAGLSPSSHPFVEAVEQGRVLARDFTTAGPERMTPLRAAELCQSAFEGVPNVRVEIRRDIDGYPLLSAVARASRVVERHRPCVIRLEIVPDGVPTRTLLLAGKGVTYDTGGADLKTGGGMAGMSRDKGGAGSVAGLVQTLSALRVPGLHVVALLGMVRNSIGEESFVSDEIITSRGGVRVRIGNTDAEGRLVLADLLAELKDEAKDAPAPTIVSMATLTGHVFRAFGPYVGALENAAARQRGFLAKLMAAGEQVGEPFESTRPRREDYAFCAPKTSAEDVLSSNRLASVDTSRGHQGPFAFLDVASGLKNAGLPFAHLDISGVVVSPPDWQAGRPTGSPIAAMTQMLLDAARGAEVPR